MNLPPRVFGAPLLLAGSLLASVLAAAPNCPDGQVWDSRNQRCVSQRTTRLPDAERGDYTNRLAQQGRDEAAIVAGNQA